MPTWAKKLIDEVSAETRDERDWERDRLLLVGPYLAAELVRILTPIQEVR